MKFECSQRTFNFAILLGLLALPAFRCEVIGTL